ncbi:hypothetical protein H257_09304 [Aphanomyces astaci]|uniref:Uncharacterized protein n=1 Tax=Aphanomyces astaci TaxID=112090 RepID=W4GB00_APHAT|nr:hypothetical protein H257_09304 [Aphanomyces astaci]ETV76867.1 hypothetical protein H257_09304 [Aphanomyces astaci]|eukprot:XP_009833779.1 hypothetical protein H257_09304 [Aphanomyces astaci]
MGEDGIASPVKPHVTEDMLHDLRSWIGEDPKRMPKTLFKMLRVLYQSGNYGDAARPTPRQMQQSINYVCEPRSCTTKVLCRLLMMRCNIGFCQPHKKIKKSITHSYSAWKKLMACPA